jgi:hypothetical protein
MTFKRRHRRTELRVVTDDERAFRDTLALITAYTKLGIQRNELQAGFLPSPRSAKNAVAPFVIVSRGPMQFTHRLDQHELAGTAEQVDRRWREWIFALVGNERDISSEWLEDNYKESLFGKPDANEVLKRTLVGAGMIVEEKL